MPSDATTAARTDEAETPNFYLNALVGAAASVVLAFLPFSTVLGGAVAGYLQGEDTGDGLRVGAVAGVFALIPLMLVLFVLGSFFAFVPFVGGPRAGVGVLGIAVLLVVLVFGTVYVVGLSALGGVLGAYLKREL